MRILNGLIAALILIFVIAWLGLWWYAQGRMESGLEAWANQLSQSPTVKVTHGSISRGTSPLAAVVTVNNLQFTLQPVAGQPPVVITVPSFAERIKAYDPLLLHLVFPSQINLDAARGDASITFGSTYVVQHLQSRALFNSSVPALGGGRADLENINLLASSGSLQVLHIDSVTSQWRLNPAASRAEPWIAGNESLNGLALSPLLAHLGSVPFAGRIGQLAVVSNVSGPAIDLQSLAAQLNALPQNDQPDRNRVIFSNVHKWAAGGGSGSFSATFSVGPSTLNADASVKFDAKVQPAGNADVTADHLDTFSETVVNTYPWTQNTVNQIEAELSPYLSTTDAGGQVLQVHLSYGKAGISIDGQRVGDMPPLDWNMLENPPPVATGDGSGADMNQ